jgi:hypothetical protein
MKPQYIFLLLAAVFITGLSDGISWALLAIPYIGFVLALTVTFCINATMGAGLLFSLIQQGMYHPKFGPVAIIGGLIPGLNVLPFWVGLVGAGIMQDKSKERGIVGEVAGVASALQSGKNPLSKAGGAVSAFKNTERLAGRPPQAANDNEPKSEAAAESRRPINLNPRVGMNSDIAPGNKTYAKAA